MDAALLARFDKLETLAFGSEPFLALRTECRNAIDTLGGLDAYHLRGSDGGRAGDRSVVTCFCSWLKHGREGNGVFSSRSAFESRSAILQRG
jgi:hypothetical protein